MIASQNKILTNPFILYAITWIGVLLVYQLEWSHLCPKLSVGYRLFLLSTCFISLLLGLATHQKRYFSYNPLRVINFRTCRKVIYWLLLLLFLEIIAARGIPLLSYISGNRETEYTDFGLPFLHVIVVNGLMICVLYSFYGIISTEDKTTKKYGYKNMILAILPFFLMFSRGGIMFCILECLILFLMSRQRISKVLFKLAAIFTFILFGFGALGNLRTDVEGVKSLILEFGKATEEFKSSCIPDEFFWTYIYIATPLANAQHMVDQNPVVDIDAACFRDFAVFELMPDLVSKRISDGKNMQRQEMDKILDAFNVASVYGRTYKYLGWWGPVYMFAFTVFFIFVTIGLIPRDSPFYVLGIVEVSMVVIMNLFDNMFIFMGLIPQPFMLILLSLKYRKHRAKQNSAGQCAV